MVLMTEPHYHTNDNGKHLSPCVDLPCDGRNKPGPNSPTIKSKRYQVSHLHDPMAKPSKVGNAVLGDGDIWIEVMCKSIKTGEFMSFFKSTKNPDIKVPDEPPTGASRVVYLESSYRERFMEVNQASSFDRS